MIELKHISKVFPTADGEFTALNDVNITIEDGDVFGIVGMSGAGKSTLIRCINRLDTPTEGRILIDGQDILAMNDKNLRAVRKRVSMIFQQFNLLMQKNVARNVRYPLEIAGVPKAKANKRVEELLEIVGLSHKASAYPAQLSGGQKQRIAIARALATNPKVLLCDEATSALDPNTTHSILTLIKDINRKLGITVVVITHQMSVVEEICSRVAILDGGKVVEEGPVAEIFANPKTNAARKLVYPGGMSGHGYGNDTPRIRVAFNGSNSTDRPLVAAMAVDCGVLLSVISADTSLLDGQVYGSMLLGLPRDKGQAAKALDYLRKVPGISVEEVQA